MERTLVLRESRLRAVPDASDASGLVVITNSAELGRCVRAQDDRAVVYATGTPLPTKELLDALAGRESCSIAVSFGTEDRTAHSWTMIEQRARCYFELLKVLLALPCRSIRLLGVRAARDPADALLDGLARCIAEETTKLRYRSLVVREDLDACSVLRVAVTSDEPTLVLRDGELFRSDWVPIAVERRTDVLRKGGTYVLLGGAGGVGRLLSRQLVDRYEGKIVAVGSRSPLHLDRKTLRTSGIAAYVQADASDLESLASAWDYIDERHGKIDGVFHLAGRLQDGLFATKTCSTLLDTLRPKVAGALHLNQLASGHVDFIANFASLSGELGNIGQSDYAAANAFLDAYAELHQDHPLTRWRSIDWGLWDSDGMQMSPSDGGLRPLSAVSAFNALTQILSWDCPRAMVYEGHVPALDGPVSDERAPMSHAVPITKEDPEEWLRAIVTRFSKLSHFDRDDDLIELGIESVVAIDIAREIERDVRRYDAKFSLSKAVLFEHASLAKLATYLLSEHRSAVSAVVAEANAATRAPTATSRIENASSTTSNELRAQLESGENEPMSPAARHRSADIAIVGMAAECPGAQNIDELWSLLLNGGSGIGLIPPTRWDWRVDYDPDRHKPRSTYGRHGGFLALAKAFDAAFFRITPAEAENMDPQERRLLHIAYHALEDASFFRARARNVGVFTAAMFGHYQSLEGEGAVFGSSFASIANRISHFFDFQGPSLALDSMCSGSLSALHLAMRSLRDRECDQTLVGACNIMPHPGKYRLLADGNFLSSSGKCHSFGIEADGYVPGEGTVAVVLKRLQDAIAQGDRIHAVIRGSAINAVGRSSGFTVPSSAAQARVIKAAVNDADVDFADVSYIEAHGTGTSLGDPIEIEGLRESYTNGGNTHAYLGSIKSNIGHLEPAAGLAALVKVVLQLRHHTLVPTLNCEIENEHLRMEGFELVKRARPWIVSGGGARTAGISSFGAGGSNAHVIVQEYCGPARLATSRQASYLFPLSAKNEAALTRKITQLGDRLSSNPHADAYAIAYTLACCREHFAVRKCFVASSSSDLLAILRAEQNVAANVAGTLANSAVHARTQYLDGNNVDWSRLYSQHSPIDLPGYPFTTEEFWAPAFEWSAAQSSSSESTRIVEPIAEAETVQLLAPHWQRESLATDAGQTSERVVVVLCDSRQMRQLRSQSFGDQRIFWAVIDATEKSDERVIPVSPRHPGGLDRLFASLAERDRPILVNLWPLLEWRNSRDETGFSGAMFRLAKGLVALRRDLTHHYVCDSDGDRSSVHAFAYCGLFRVAAIEQPTIEAATVELPASELGAELAHVIERAMHKQPARDMRWRFNAEGWQRFVYREVPRQLAPSSVLRDSGVYLIAGGTGKIGLALARALVERFSATVILLGRSPPHTVAALTQEFSGGSGHVGYEQVDLADTVAVRQCVERTLAKYGALHGVFQAAGVLKDELLRTKTWDSFRSVAETKIAGTDHLDLATAQLPLDCFVLFSSVASAFGNAGQADYVVGNSYLDRFAEWREQQVARGFRAGRTLSVNWPLWRGGGMSLKEANERYLREELGIVALENEEGIELLLNALDCPAYEHQLVILKGQRPKIRASLLAGSDGRPQEGVKHARDAAALDLTRVIALVRTAVAELTRHREEDIGITSSFGDLGISSVLLEELAMKLQRRFGSRVVASTFFTYDTIEKIAGYLGGAGEPTDAPRTAALEAKTIPGGPGDATEATVISRGFAIVGLSGQLPGSDTLQEFWRLLCERRTAIQPMERWSDRTHWGGAITGIEQFDARFFNISGREAMLMDPQHRLFLQAAYNTFLDAGYAPRDLRSTGVFAGVQFNDYQVLLQQWQRSRHPYAATGNAHAMLANRVSFYFDLHGPSQTVDTACSSALVALLRATAALERHECDFALAGAVSLMIDPVVTDAAKTMGILSPQQRCATFDEAADGYVRGEGVGCVLLKRYADAVREGDHIYAVIVGGGENHGGRASSLTAPNPRAQSNLLVQCYSQELARDVSYVETHGTGTKLGDPIEIDALKAAWRQLEPVSSARPIVLGAVKPNIGHLEPAAGIASLLKVLLAFEHELIPANANFSRVNPRIDLAGTRFRLAEESVAWPRGSRVAGISSFGFGGSNAHVILSDVPESANEPTTPSLCLVTASARSLRALAGTIRQFADALEKLPLDPRHELANIAFTANCGREHFEYRLAWIVASREELIAELRAIDLSRAQPIRASAPELDLPALQAGAATRRDELERWRHAYLDGGVTNLMRMYGDTRLRRVHLPGYSFDTQRYWFETAADVESTRVAEHA